MMGNLRFGVAISLVMLSGCASSIDLSVPANEAQHFTDCVANPSVSWEFKKDNAPVVNADIGAIPIKDVQHPDVAKRHRRTLSTTTSDSFHNIYREAIAEAKAKIKPDKSGEGSSSTNSADQSSAAAVDRVGAILGHTTQQNINSLYNSLSGTSTENQINLSVGDVSDYLQRVQQSTQLGDWSLHANAAVKSFSNATKKARAELNAESAKAAPVVTAALADMTTALYIEAYMRAYFRNGEFVQGTINSTSLINAIPALKSLKDPNDIDTVTNILKKIDKTAQFGKIASSGFVTRNGTSFQFPSVTFSIEGTPAAAGADGAINITFDPTRNHLSSSNIDYVSIGGQVVRVLLEAIFDAHDRLPAVSNATGVTFPSDRKNIEYIHLPDFSKIENRAPYNAVTADEFGAIDAFANQVDGAAAVATGQILRGLGPVALNNEALAKLIEAVVGSSVHKVAEKLGWCWYAVSKSTDSKAPSKSSIEEDKPEDGQKVAQIVAPKRVAPTGSMRKVTVNVSF